MIRLKAIYIIGILILLGSCAKKEYGIEYQDDYPNLFSDNWIAFEFQGGDLEGQPESPYDLVVSLDPNHEGKLIFDKIYNSDLRVRASYSDTSFTVTKGINLETVNTNNYGIHYISLKGYVTTNPVLTNFAYMAAQASFENAEIKESDIDDILFIRAGYYDSAKVILDTTLIIGYRKTGFEDVDYQP